MGFPQVPCELMYSGHFRVFGWSREDYACAGVEDAEDWKFGN